MKTVWFALVIFFSVSLSVLAFDGRDADIAFHSFNTNFYVLKNGRAHYKQDTDGGASPFWVQAEQIEMIEDVYDRTHSEESKKMIAQSIAGFIKARGKDWSSNKYNDDIMWMTIASARAYQDTGKSLYRKIAKHNFDLAYARAASPDLGGGLWWDTDNASKNACVNGPAAIAACLLSEICHDPSYVEKAKAIYAWERSTLFSTNSGAVHDNIRTNNLVGRKAFTYNEGTLIGAADLLWKLTGDTNYLSDALLAAHFTRHRLSHDGTLPVYGSGDVAGFNGIYMRWLARFVNDDQLWPEFYDWMDANANAAWHVRRTDGLSWQNWNDPTPPGTLNSWNCSDTVVILQVVPPNLVVSSD